MVGSIDAFDGLCGSGRIPATGAPQQSALEVRIDNLPVAATVTVANAPSGDADLQDVAFEFTLVAAADLHGAPVQVSVHLAGDDTPLASGTFAAAAGVEAAAGAAEWHAFIEGHDGSRVWGWVMKGGQVEPQTVDILVNDAPAALAVRADVYRSDVHEAGFGSGFHGFVAEIADTPSFGGGLLTVSLRDPADGRVIATRTFGEAPWLAAIDALEDHRLHGWAMKRGEAEPVAIDIVVNGEPVAVGVRADLFRGDLLGAGSGAGFHGFEVPIPHTLRAEEAPLEIILREATTGEVLTARTFAPKPWLAFIEGLDGRRICGWVMKGGEVEPQAIDILVNDVPVLENLLASEFRPDVFAEGFGTGCYGFDVRIESILDIAGDEARVAIRSAADGRIRAERVFPHNPFRQQFIHKIETAGDALISGWFIDKNWSAGLHRATLYLDDLPYTTVDNAARRPDLKKIGADGSCGGFTLKSPLRYMEPGEHRLALRFPNGMLSRAFKVQIDALPPVPEFHEDAYTRNGVTIVVPIYNAADDVDVCIRRLLDHTPATARILLIDDCSTDPRISRILGACHDTPQIRILRNAENLGFTRTVNRGIAEAGRDDVILLNSDARVTPGWLESMVMAACSRPRVATVTAMSDRAGAFSAPNAGNDNALPEGIDEITFARAFRRRSLGLYPQVPTGNGFCMFVSRACLDSIGPLDAEAFPRGYGEENDFCMRALRAGWRNLIDDRTYVFHDRSKSFGEAKTELMAAGRAVVDARYPEYKSAIQLFGTCEKIALARHQARLALRDCLEGRAPLPRVLFVVSTSTGGTPQTNRDLMEALADAVDGWVLRCDSRKLELSRLSGGTVAIVRTHELDEPVDPTSHRSGEYDAVVGGWLAHYDFDLVHVRHIAWHSLSLPRIARLLGKKVVFSFHDFYTLSPTIKLIDDEGVFLGPTYLPEGSIHRESLWPAGALPTPSATWLDFWRRRFEAELAHCDAFVTTSHSARALILDTLPTVAADRFHVIPHGRDFAEFSRVRQLPRHGAPVRILVPGNINAAKGLEIILALAEHDRAGWLEFHILGSTDAGQRKPPRTVISHGRYERDQFAKKAAAIRPHVGAVFSIWDETYCHTLTELWSAGLPAMVFDFPTVAGRVRESGCGWVLDHHDIPALYEEILRIAFDPEEESRADAALRAWQNGPGIAGTTRVMAASYLDIYRDVLRAGRPDTTSEARQQARIAVVCPGDADLRKAAGSTHIRIWERTFNSIARNIDFIRMRPDGLLASLRAGTIDGAIIQRTAIPRTLVPALLDAFRDSGRPYLLDLDDDLRHVPEQKDPTGTYADYAPALERLIAQAARVSVSTPHLAGQMAILNPRTVLLPNALSERLWRAPPLERVQDNTIRALYMGTRTHHDDLGLILPALDAVAAECPEFRLTLVGVTGDDTLAETRGDWLKTARVPADHQDYSAFVPWLRNQAASCDFALAPLEDSAFNESKSSLKLMDYAGLGLPVVASDVAIYRTDAPGVRLVENTTEGWIAGLRVQIALGAENAALGAAQRDWVLGGHMLGDTLGAFDALLLEMLAESGRR